MINKLSPELRRHVRAKQARDAAPTPAEAPAPSAERIDLLVEFTGDVADLKAVGFEPDTLLRHPQKGYTIAAGTLPVDRLADLAAIDHVGVVEGPQKLRPTLNYSLPTIRGDLVQQGTPSRTGRGVVIGIIDSGVDWRHGAFVDPETGNSRILAYWDQGLDVKPGESPGPVVFAGQDPMGVVYSQEEISRALRGEAIVRSRDRSPHGTHVAGIAAGNGAPAACCHRPYSYVGVAPNAELIVVRQVTIGIMGESPRLVRAITYILEHPAVVGTPPAPPRPVVINISLGMNVGAHDGTSAVELAIDAAVALPRRAIVVGSGNEADMYSHLAASVPGRTAPGPGTLNVDFTVHDGWNDEGTVDLWYARAGTLHIEVIAPSGETSGQIQHGTDGNFIANPAAPEPRRSRVFIDGTINGLHGRDNNFRINIRQPESGSLPHGPWRIRLTNPNAGAVGFHGWIERNDPATPKLEFLHPDAEPLNDGRPRASPESSLTIPSTSAGAITVGAQSNKTNCCNCHPLGGLQIWSGQGPVARNADANPKPDITAPGLQITSAQANACNFPGRCCSCCPDACCFLYEDMDGTSMAAPHVSGTIALMFEENPNLTRDEILTHLSTSATPPPAGPRTWWGAGKLNAQGAVAAVRAAGGGGGGGGGPHPHVPLDAGGISGGRGRVHPVFRVLRARLMALPEGIEIAAAISRHFSEVRRLINTNRRVATMWHRAAGPWLLRRLFQDGIDHELPVAIAGVPDGGYLDHWCELLARHGSPRLRAGLQRYRAVVIDLLRTPLAMRAAAEVAVAAEASSGARVALDASPCEL